MGDLNAKIGADNTGYEQVMGKHGLGRMNENGEQFAEFFAQNNLVIGGSVFEHRRIHKATWMSPDHMTENQIDHVCICRRFRRALQDVRVKRGADAASDHHMVLANLKLRLKRCKPPSPTTRTRYNVDLLRDKETADMFQINLTNRCSSSFMMMKTCSLKRSGSRRRRCGLRHARRLLAGKRPNIRTG